MLHPPPVQRGCTIWLTGAPGAPRGALARAVGRRIAEAGRRVEVIDGCEVRARAPRIVDEAEHIGWVSRALARNGVIVVAAPSTPSARGPSAPLVEVHVASGAHPAPPSALAVSPAAMGEGACVDAVIAALRARGHLH